MKFVLNGGLIIGTVDGANVEIVDEIGDQNAFTFGHLAENVPDLRHKHHFATPRPELDANLAIVFKEIQINTFGNAELFEPLLNSIEEGGDYYLVSDDFGSYLDAQKLVDELYVSKDAWAERSILAVARMGTSIHHSYMTKQKTNCNYYIQATSALIVPLLSMLSRSGTLSQFQSNKCDYCIWRTARRKRRKEG